MSYKVLLVDDECIYLDYLSQIIDWDSMKCSICGYAKDGEEALQVIRKEVPDIIFMDINMSRMNGLEACEAMKSWSLESRIIIMTAYDEFSFAHQAIKLNVFDYLLKPFDGEELQEALHKCIEDIETSKKNKQMQQELFLRGIIEFQPDLDILNEEIAQTRSPSLVAVIKIRKGYANYNLSVIRNLLNRYLNGIGIENYCLRNDGSCITLVHVMNSSERTMEELKRRYAELLGDEGAYMLDSVAMGNIVSGLEQLQNSYKQAQMVYENSIKLNEKIACFSDIQNLNKEVTFYSTQDVNLLIKYFEMREYAKVDTIIEKMFGLSDNQMFSFQYVISIYHALSIGVHSYFHYNTENQLSDYMQTQESIISELKDCYSTHQVKDIIKNYVYEMLTDCTYIQISSKKEILVTKIEKYLQNHYSEANLSVSNIAENLFFENSYIRRVFKTQTGRTIMQRLEEIRIEKAKELLREEQYRCSEVAEMIGFSDQFYFSKRFKLFCNCTPSEYQSGVMQRR